MREIDCQQITDTVHQMALKAGHTLPEGVLSALKAAVDAESGVARSVMEMLVENAKISSDTSTALCQDCGLVVIFVKLGRDCHIRGDLYDAINAGVRSAYEEGYLRKSVLSDPLRRDSNSGDNTPAVVHVTLVEGDRIELDLAPKGGGSENMSAVDMLVPAVGRQGVIDRVVAQVKLAGGKPCPPLVIGVGIGGTMEKAAILSKWALMREMGKPASDAEVAELEREILEAVNATGVGPMGLGGKTTALAVHVEKYPCHIASLPLAINLQCHAARHERALI